ncbi:MAG: hypothetical protein CMH56_05210 [Myxococcales bacterium]|nr:hypothetical protein [Myxococcales bacterium]
MIGGLTACVPSNTEPTGECQPGQSLTCSCEEIVLGTKTCGDDGTFGACECDWGEVEGGETAPSADAGPAGDAPAPDEGPCRDLDDDGYYDCIDENHPGRPQEVDCDDLHWTIQPGGIEYPDNGVDDDCDGEIDEADATCACPNDNAETGLGLAQALGLCGEFVQEATFSGDKKQKFWGTDYFEINSRDESCLTAISTGATLPVFEYPTKNYNKSKTTSGGTHTVKFSSNEADATFECQVDEGNAEPCTSPFTLPAYDHGIHRLHIWATDSSGNKDSIPLLFIWDAAVATSGAFIDPDENLDVLAPNRGLEIVYPGSGMVLGDIHPTITGYASPGRSINLKISQDGTSIRTFYVTTNDQGRWAIDDDKWAYGYSSAHSLEDGFYEIKASINAPWNGSYEAETTTTNIEISTAANADPIPVTHIEDLERTGENAYEVTFEADHDSASFECRLLQDGTDAPWVACTSPRTLSVTEEDVYIFQVRATVNSIVEEIPDAIAIDHENSIFEFHSPANGASTSEVQPAIMGQGEIDADLSWTITSDSDATLSFSGDTEVDYLGQWSVLPEDPLPTGTYTFTVAYTNSFAPEETFETSFTIDPTAADTTAALTFYGSGLDVQPGTSFNSSDTDPDPEYDGSWSSVNDLASLTLKLKKPGNARGFSFNFMFISAEFPEFLCMSFNDTFYAVVEAGSINNGRRRNVSFDQDNNEITVNNAFFEPANDWSVDLSTTPYGVPRSSMCGNSTSFDDDCTTPEYCADEDARNAIGSGTGWLTTSVPLSELDEEFTLTFSMHDEGDGVYDSVGIIDNFRWVANPTSLTTEKEPEDD